MTEELPTPESREELYLAKAAGESVEVPTPESRKELFLNAIAQGGGGGGTSNFNELTNRPKFNGTVMTGDTNVTDTTYSNFVGTDGTSAGTAGLVPAPATTDADKYLKSDGTWATAGGGGDTVYSNKNTSNSNTGGAVYIGNLDSTQTEQADPTTTDTHIKYFWALPTNNTDVPLQSSVNIMGTMNAPHAKESVVIGDGANAYSSECVAIGHSSRAGQYSISLGNSADAGTTSSENITIGHSSKTRANYNIALGNSAETAYRVNNSIAIGRLSKASDDCNYSIALGSYAVTSRVGEVNVGTGSNSYGYNSTPYRVIGGVHDGQNNHDAATVAQGNTLATSAPTTATVGVLGQLYTDTTNMHTYQLGSIDTTDPSNPVYNWVQRW